MDEARHPARRGTRIDDLALGASTQGPLRQILDLVQGTPGAVLADVRVATLPLPKIEALAQLALREADACVDRSRMLLHLLELSIPQSTPDPERVAEVTRHAARLITDAKIWRELAGNATFYIEHPAVATQLHRDLTAASRVPVDA